MKTLAVAGKVSDMCDIRVIDLESNTLWQNTGDVPRNLGIGGGDYILLNIDIESGRILNWNAEIVKAAIQERVDERGE